MGQHSVHLHVGEWNRAGCMRSASRLGQLGNGQGASHEAARGGILWELVLRRVAYVEGCLLPCSHLHVMDLMPAGEQRAGAPIQQDVEQVLARGGVKRL